MRSQIILLLLAVYSNNVIAGLLRYSGEGHVQQNKFRRFLNTSSIASPSPETKTSTPIIIPSTSSSSSAEITSNTLRFGEAPTTALVQSPSTSLSALGESSAAAPSALSSAVNTQSSVPSTPVTKTTVPSTSSFVGAPVPSNSQSTVSAAVESVSSASKPTEASSALSGLGTNGNVKVEVATPSVQSTQSYTSISQSPSLSAASIPQTTQAPTQAQSSAENHVSSAPTSASISAPVVQFAPSNSAEFDSVSAASTLATPSQPGVQYPGTQSGNLAMATGFNQAYKKLDETSQCNPKDTNQATVCISGELASCQADGTYVLKSCPDGQSCYALPRPSGTPGVDVTCAVPSDAAARMSGESNSGNSPMSASQVTPSPQSAVTPTSGNAQSLSKFPETESVQMPVQRLSSLSQATTAPQSQPAASVSPTIATVPAATETKGTQSSAAEIQSSSKGVASSLPIQGGPVIVANSQTATPSQPQSSTQSVQVLQSFPAAQVTLHTQQTASASPNGESNSAPVHTQQASATPAKSTSETVSAASSAAAADGGPLFSLPTTSQKESNQQPQPTASSTPVQGPSKATEGPSLLAQQPPAISTETSLAPVPHIAQAAPEPPQPTKSAAASAQASNANGGGIQIVPEPASPSTTQAPGANEKLAVQNPASSSNSNANPNGTPIYITVTVTTTTTAHDLSPTH